jgi:pimeloyl-ACP methyl ester carboxylesterase
MPTIISKDGTTIAYDQVGEGPAVILVEGATVARGASALLAQLLASDFSVYYYDRRGCGERS